MPQNGGQRSKVLIVDDIPSNIMILMELLKNEYSVVAANNGEKALRLAAADPKPDIILLDVMMPGMDGYDTCRLLKTNLATRNIPVIFITALSGDDDEALGLELGAVDFVNKPFKPHLVLARVRNHLELKRHRDHLSEMVNAKTAQLQEALNKLRDASLDTINRLSKAAEYKDEDTGAHILRMSNYSAAVARSLGLHTSLVSNILYAAPMHDVGKIGIPDNILLKPGPLDKKEWVIMKTHTTIGGRILEGSDAAFINLAKVVALAHHEKWDGSGYPLGLKGKDIPQAGRIVAIADVFDALTSQRPYKKAFSLEKSFDNIRKSSGSHFDPEVVEAFFAVQEEILDINKKYAD